MTSLIELVVRASLAAAAALPFVGKCSSLQDAVVFLVQLPGHEQVGTVVCAYLSATATVELVRRVLQVWR